MDLDNGSSVRGPSSIATCRLSIQISCQRNSTFPFPVENSCQQPSWCCCSSLSLIRRVLPISAFLVCVCVFDMLYCFFTPNLHDK